MSESVDSGCADAVAGSADRGTEGFAEVRRVGVVDDHVTASLGIAAMLADSGDITFVASATTVDELLASHPLLDLVILDLRLGDDSTPTENVARLRSAGIEVIAYTSGEAPALVREATKAGVAGMIRKAEPAEVLVEAIRSALRGEVVASTDWAAAVDSDPDLPSAELTAREIEVLRLYASGEKAFRVATVLGISRETVLDHIRRIRTKYAEADRPAHTKIDLYRRAVEDRVLPTPRSLPFID